MEDIRDSKHNKIGYTEKRSDGSITIYDLRSSRLGEIRPIDSRLFAYDKRNSSFAYFDPSRDATFEKNGRRIGGGNLLTSLFFQQ